MKHLILLLLFVSGLVSAQEYCTVTDENGVVWTRISEDTITNGTEYKTLEGFDLSAFDCPVLSRVDNHLVLSYSGSYDYTKWYIDGVAQNDGSDEFALEFPREGSFLRTIDFIGTNLDGRGATIVIEVYHNGTIVETFNTTWN